MIPPSVTSIQRSQQLFNYIKLTVLTQAKVRFKYAILDSATIEQKLGVPVKPKKPIVPFFRYMIEIRPSVVTQHPTLRPRDHVVLVSKMWHLLDVTKREKYSRAFADDFIVYRKQLAKYNETITEDDIRKVKESRKALQEEIEKRKYVRLQRKKAGDLDRPKKPQSAFLKYLAVQGDRQPNEKYYDYMRRKSSEWKNLSEGEKNSYRPPTEDMEEYKRKLLKWNGEMIKSGNYHVLRSELPNYSSFEDVLNPKKDET